MSDRTELLCDVAIHVAAESGLRGLTHRAVDAAAGVAAGSTSYYFRTRDALVAAMVTRVAQLELTEIDAARRATPTTPEGLVVTVCDLVENWTGPAYARTRVRLELLLHMQTERPWTGTMHSVRQQFLQASEEALTAAGCNASTSSTRHFITLLDGITYQAIAWPGSFTREELAGLVRGALVDVAGT